MAISRISTPHILTVQNAAQIFVGRHNFHKVAVVVVIVLIVVAHLEKSNPHEYNSI